MCKNVECIAKHGGITVFETELFSEEKRRGKTENGDERDEQRIRELKRHQRTGTGNRGGVGQTSTAS